MSEGDVLMGELRSLLAQEPGKKTWLALCEVLDRWPADALARRDEEALPYCRDHLLTWGARVNTRPPDAWFARWLGGDPAVVALMGLGYLNSAKAEDASGGALRRCSYYTITSQRVSWVSNSYDAADVHDTTHHTAAHEALVQVAHESVDAVACGVSKLCGHLGASHNEAAADILRVSFVINGVEAHRSALMPDLTVRSGGHEVRLVVSRPTALERLLALPKKRWSQVLNEAPVSLQDAAGEVLWRGELRAVGRAAPWAAVVGGRFRPDVLALDVDVAPLLAELPQLPAFHRLPEASMSEKTWRFGY